MSAPASPPPWQWSEPHGRETLLEDANGDVVLAYGNDSTIVVASPYVREAVRSAPEMEHLLRWFADMGEWIQPVHPNLAKARALLRRLDEGRRG